MQSKNELRRALIAASRAQSADALASSDREIAARVQALDEWRRAEAVFLYVSVRGEPDTRALIREALEAGRLVAVPRCLEGGAMEARRIRSLDELQPAAYGLREPTEDAPLIGPERFDLAVIPCLAADRRGMRLGHGAGYYDRYLPRTRAFRLCLCRGSALLDALPADAYDAQMDAVITEGETLRI